MPSAMRQLEVRGPYQEDRAAGGRRAARLDEGAQRAVETARGRRCALTGGHRCRARLGAIAQQHRVAPIDLQQHPPHEAHGPRIVRQLIADPLALASPRQQPDPAHDLEVPRHARLALPDGLSEVGHRDRPLCAQRQ